MPDAIIIFTGIVFAQMFYVGLRARQGSAAAFLRDTVPVLRSLAAALIGVLLTVFV